MSYLLYNLELKSVCGVLVAHRFLFWVALDCEGHHKL